MNLLFVGLDNPQSSDPRYALWPSPAGCAGHRLLMMMQRAWPDFKTSGYLRIARTNLFPIGMCPRAFRTSALRIAGEHLVNQTRGKPDLRVVLFGTEVADAVIGGMKYKPLKFVVMEETSYVFVPHPSGRNRYYNNEMNSRRVGKFLVKLL